jgi:hypothetical protein
MQTIWNQYKLLVQETEFFDLSINTQFNSIHICKTKFKFDQ